MILFTVFIATDITHSETINKYRLEVILSPFATVIDNQPKYNANKGYIASKNHIKIGSNQRFIASTHKSYLEWFCIFVARSTKVLYEVMHPIFS